ncbi:UNVERIFIED_CONTAM: hypothetical protein Sradi_7112700 [Sesamum radiatum]|uniref:Reverse transcriptase domain-containing protein n=1 Tax=Sesamum radiatum TaxID=300843 RepID=A0AAW2J1X3_SESRA
MGSNISATRKRVAGFQICHRGRHATGRGRWTVLYLWTAAHAQNHAGLFWFSEDDISLTPVWATLPSLPLECWNPNALSKIGSKLGNPMAMDSLTMNMERISYARILVEVDASKELIDQGLLPRQPADRCKSPMQVTPKKAQKSDWTLVQRRHKATQKEQGPQSAAGEEPTPQAQQQGSLTADSNVQRQQGMLEPQPHAAPAGKQDRPEQNSKGHSEEHSPAGSSGSSTESEASTGPLKQNGVAHLVKDQQLCLLGILETKLTAPAIAKILHRLFPGWCHSHNFDTIAGGRILIIWNPAIIDLQPEDISTQVIHCRVTNISTQLSFYVSFTYGLYSVVHRRGMWDKLLEVGQPLTLPWLVLGDFNCVKSTEEKQLGVMPTWYELKDFNDCCLSLGLSDAPTTGCFYTWYSNSDSNPVWCKLDRVLLNNECLEAGLQCSAHFKPPGCLSDHSPGIVSIFDHPPPKPKNFRFFNMWADHPDFLATVEEVWGLNVEGTAQFKLCKKLKALKHPLKTLNRLHYSHISVRARDADLALQEAQLHLESHPEDAAVRGSLRDLRKKAVFLAEAERHFYFQKAKIHFLKMGDRNTKFFHDMVKRNAAKSSILAITKSDGSTITSTADIGQEFVTYFTSLLGTAAQTLPVDNDVFDWGPKLLGTCIRAVQRGYTVGAQPLYHCPCAQIRAFPTVADYRPISCCNVIYKAITKIIADRLSTVLEHLIDRSQAAFVGGRSITDNIFLAQEMVRQYTRKRISPRCTINVDLRKAFDSVSWTFLSRVPRVWLSPSFYYVDYGMCLHLILFSGTERLTPWVLSGQEGP